MTLEVVEGGLLTTIQDAGRPGLGHLGVPEGGAVDPDAFAAANLLVGNDAGAAAIEMTLAGGTFRVRSAVTIGIAGGDLGGIARPGDRRLEPWSSHRLDAGDTVAFPGRVAGGARTYLALPGGVDVPEVLGSRSTCLVGRFGGIGGRPLRAGDLLTAVATDPVLPAIRLEARERTGTPSVVRFVAIEEPGIRHAVDTLASVVWKVGPESDRMGVRLAGGGIGAPTRSVVSHGVTWGTVQLPPDGTPVVLLADRQPTGGYPVLAVAITADRGILGGLGPGDPVRFEEVTRESAIEALRGSREGRRTVAAEIESLLRAARDDERWLDASRWAGG